MTDMIEQLETPKPEPRRDQYDRALLLDPRGNRVPYTRVSTVAKALDDKDTIINYRQRLTAVGLTRRKDLHDVVAMMADPEGTDKGELRRIVTEAEVAGGGGFKANLGTARHKAIERIDNGEDPASLNLPTDIAVDVAAYMAELERCGFRPEPTLNEFHGVKEGFDYNGLGVSGTGDKVLRRLDDGALFVGDVKTGQEVKYAMLAWAVQFAIYANFDNIYDVRTDTRLPMPDLSRQVALAIWLPAGRGTCKLLEVDIANGLRYAELAVQVRGARAHGKVDLRRDGCLMREYEPRFQQSLHMVSPLPTDGNVDRIRTGIDQLATETTRRNWLRDRLKAASAEYRNLVATWWTEWNARAADPIPPLNDLDHHHSTFELDRIETWCNEAEAVTQETLTADPTVVNAHALLKQFPGTIDEGTELSEDKLTALSANLGLWCQPKWLGLMNGWRDEAIRLGHDFGVKECPTTRRYSLYELGANLCNICEGDLANIDLAWAVLATALDWASVPDIPFGLAFSLLSIDDIEKCMGVVRQVPFLALTFDNNTGCPKWAPITADNNQR